jgi:phenylacetate-CoA ligase
MKSRLDLEALYLKAPVWIQDILVSIEGWRIKRRRYDAAFMSRFKEFVGRSDHNSIIFQDTVQEEKLRNLLKTARLSLYWNDRFLNFGVDPDGENVFAELAKLPVLTKTDVKEHAGEIDISEQLALETITCHTSGTTGSGLVFPVCREAEQEQWATWWRYRSWHGIGFDTWCGYFGGRSLVALDQKKAPFWRVNRPGRQLMFSAYHLSDRTAGDYISALNRYKVPWVHGYPSTLAYLAGLKRDLGLPDVPSLKVVTIGAESLLPQQKALIENVFGVPVRQHYGMAEGVANISECPDGRLHVDEDFSYVEFIPIPGEKNSYRIVGTNWANPAFPLLRYDTGDIATIENETCTCPRGGRIVSRIDGRKEDFVVLPSGAKVGRLDHIFKDMIRINAAQIYQPNAGEILMRIVPGAEYDKGEDEAVLISETRKRLGDEIGIRVDYVQELLKTKAGKLRFVVSDLEENKIA